MWPEPGCCGQDGICWFRVEQETLQEEFLPDEYWATGPCFVSSNDSRKFQPDWSFLCSRWNKYAIDSDTPLSDSLFVKLFKLIEWQNSQIFNLLRVVDHPQLSFGNSLNVWRKPLAKRTVLDGFGFFVEEGNDYGITNNSKRYYCLAIIFWVYVIVVIGIHAKQHFLHVHWRETGKAV